MTALAFTGYGTATTRATSDAARDVADQLGFERRRLQNSFALGLGTEVFDELCKVADACQTRNWDGYEAAAVTDETYRAAYRLLEALPLGTPVPTVGAEPDGHLTLEWHRSARRTLSVSVSPEGDLHYAALLGRSKAYGTEPFFGVVPTSILDLINRVTAA